MNIRIKKILNSKKGFMSIVYILMALTLVTFISGSVEILRRGFLLSETQGIMDTTSVMALHRAVDNDILRAWDGDINNDILNRMFDESVAENYFRSSIRSQIRPEDGVQVKDITVREVNSNFTTGNTWGDWGLGESNVAEHNRRRPQATIDAVVLLTLNSTTMIDYSQTIGRTYYNSRSNDNFQVTSLGINDNGESELLIRTHSRLIF